LLRPRPRAAAQAGRRARAGRHRLRLSGERPGPLRRGGVRRPWPGAEHRREAQAAEVALRGHGALFLRCARRRDRGEAEALGARRARDHRRQPRLPGARRARSGADEARHGMAGYRHPRSFAGSGTLHRDHRAAPGPEGRLPRGDRLAHGLHRRHAARGAREKAGEIELRRIPDARADGAALLMDFIDLKSQYRALKREIDERIQRVLDHGQYILGPEIGELEQKLAAYTGARHCVTVASGTEALLIALMALDLKPGDEVITTPFTFIATAEMIVLLGGKAVLVDAEEETANIDAARIAAAITPRTRAIMPVSLYGQPADMDEINALAARHRLPLIEDAAQSFGAIYKGRRSCALSTIGCTSFFPSKPLGCYGDGGAIFTDDAALASAMR